MKSSLWFVIVLVTGIVGFLVGYSVSSSTGSGQIAKAAAAKEPAHHAESAGYGAQPAAAQPAPTPGYGAPAAPAKPASAGGYR
jgi:hypothetical protein